MLRAWAPLTMEITPTVSPVMMQIIPVTMPTAPIPLKEWKIFSFISCLLSDQIIADSPELFYPILVIICIYGGL